MANLDKLLRKLEQNKENAEKTTTHQLTIAGETFDVRTMTRAEKRRYVLSQEINQDKTTLQDIAKKATPLIYTCLDLAPLAVRAIEQGTIKKHYEVVDLLFEPEEIIDIISFIEQINATTTMQKQEEKEDIKK